MASAVKNHSVALSAKTLKAQLAASASYPQLPAHLLPVTPVRPLPLRESLRRSLCVGFVLTMMAMAHIPSVARADDTPAPIPPIPVSTIGQTIENPLTGNQETITAIVSNAAVLTDAGNVILRANAVGQEYVYNEYQVDGDGNLVLDANDNPIISNTITYVITAVTTVDGKVTSVSIRDKSDPDADIKTQPVVYTPDDDPNNMHHGQDGSSGSIPGNAGFTPAVGDINPLLDARIARHGGNGSHGGGIRVCFGFLGCITIGVNPGAGGNGQDGEDITRTVEASHGDIQTVSDNLPGIVVSSVGGNGGRGGDGYGINIKPAPGGASGKGGDVTLTNHTNVTTSGKESHGIFVQSRSGQGGKGGTNYDAITGGGTGGEASQGGNVEVFNTGNIVTQGEGAIGIFAQSLAGGAGSGGSGYGIVGNAGEGNVGGHGGTVIVEHSGSIITEGDDAHGILAQSIGGSGGNAGSGGGIVGFGDGGEAGGDGNTVTVIVHDGATIATSGDTAHGVFAQSVGGGGGAGGSGSGIAGFGAEGGAGGMGNTVEVTNHGTITTAGAQSRGILAQSIGGGGGSGGSGSGLVGLGARGGTASFSGDVTIENTGSIETLGNRGDGIFVQSVGGGGGDAGGGSGWFAIGGDGGGGGDGGKVTVNHSGAIRTYGDDARGIFAQSVGGGGGNGGNATSGGLFVSMAIGGSGGDGGKSDEASINFTNKTVNVGGVPTSVMPYIHTGERIRDAEGNVVSVTGDRSTAVLVQSIGGGGGSGGLAASGSIGYGGSASLSIGGSGGGGGDGGKASVDGDFVAVTEGDYSTGLLAQSVGGGGGNGGMAVAVSLAVGETAAVSVSAALGGDGGDGGDGGEVTVTSGGAIRTEGDFSGGLVTQSIGGGGGNGGMSISVSGAAAGVGAVAAAIGGAGDGAGGGDGGVVNTTFDGTISTAGHNSTGALIQSVGGGGGAGGYNISGAAGFAGGAAGGAGVGIGGSGGLGGAGGDVTGTIKDVIVTEGDRSFGAVVQSIGGGGGAGGMNISGAIAGAKTASGAVSVGIGGAGGAGGDAGTVTATLDDVFTSGNQATGVIVQSVGGGGGAGGMNVSGGVAVSSTASGSVSVGMGGSGGIGGDGKAVVAHAANILTTGNQANAFIAQSVGGGGGAGGMNISGGLAASENSGSVAVGLGGNGAGGGDADDVTATVVGEVETRGSQSDGLIVQSVGGGGGAGGMNISGTVALSTGSNGSVGFGMGGFGGTGGVAGNAHLDRTGNTVTRGDSSHAIVVQSVGGGGGGGGMNVTGNVSLSSGGTTGSAGVGIGGFGGAGGDAGKASANITGSVIATGVESDIVQLSDPEDADETPVVVKRVRAGGSSGVIVQSIGGGGGNGGMNISGVVALAPPSGSSYAGSIGIGGFGNSAGDASTATLNIHSAPDERSVIAANGDDQSAVLVQSVGGSGGHGGINIAAGLSLDGTAAIGIGGFGGGGGKGDTATASVDADLYASGDASRGMIVQSIGGGGGNGGINISAGVTAGSGSGSPALAFGMGGNGGAGNKAGDVQALHSGLVNVEGVNSIGLLAQSVGGGGGDGGLNVAASGTRGKDGFGVGVGIGGSGGTGADGGDVKLNSTGTILINAKQVGTGADVTFVAEDLTGGSAGILAQSVGGGGGNGGINVSGVAAPSGNPLMVGVGGSGATGGDAGNVSVIRGLTDDGSGNLVETPETILVFGDNSQGLMAQSVGGGGGRAGINTMFGGANNPNGVSAMINVGGDGANAGHAGKVDVNHVGNIYTRGDNSDALLAQSVGGGGGNANYSLGAAYVKGANSLALAVGGGAGAAGHGDNVIVKHDGTISTTGYNAAGVRAQSIGGGGGNTAMTMAHSQGADRKLNVTLGQEGGAGGKGGDVYVAIKGQIDTLGDHATAIYAQSVGGGGGKSSSTSISASSGGDNKSKSEAKLAVGHEGGVGAEGGNVEVSNESIITTAGDNAKGILAQSVGGGGGEGGAVTNTAINNEVSANVGVGGTGGTGGTAGTVEVDNMGSIYTTGRNADAIHAQSVGGGGGIGGMARYAAVDKKSERNSTSLQLSVGGSGGEGNDADAVTVANSGGILTTGEEAYGIRAQSIGGGGGIAGAVFSKTALKSDRSSQSLNVSIGGSGGDGGKGADVDVVNEGIIHTAGRGAIAISANSIGGGGGNASLISDKTTGATNSGKSNRVKLNIGGSGGDGGTGGDVTVRNLSTAAGGGVIITEGQDAHGIFAQSLSGGGGNGSAIISVMGTKSGSESTSIGLNVGGSGGSGERGGEVRVENTGSIATLGDNAHGVLAQSIGGGGGNGGAVISSNLMFGGDSQSTPIISVGGMGGNGGDGGDVIVDNSGSITTIGLASHGIMAQSIGGGGGNAGMAVAATNDLNSLVLSNMLSATLGAAGGGQGGLGGHVTVNHSGDITVLGEKSQAIIAQSINGGGGTLALNLDGLTTIPPLPIVGGGSPSSTPTADPLVAARAGADGVQNMNAGKVEVNTTGTIRMAGDNNVGSMMQSIGGGGGTVSVDIALKYDPDAEQNAIETQDAIEEELNNPSASSLPPSPAMFSMLGAPVMPMGAPVVPMGAPVMPMGGPAPASAPLDFNIHLGETNGSGNNASAVISQNTGEILISGNNSFGILHQSIGGGGGNTDINISAPANTRLGNIHLNFGSENSHNSSGNLVQSEQDGLVSTSGNVSAAAVFQSIGGGGGVSNTNLTGESIASARGFTTMGANGGSGLDGNAIDLQLRGGIVTFGDDSPNLVAQSIGAGGGLNLTGGTMNTTTLGASGNAEGDAGDITISNDGVIYSEGARSHAVFLQSIGGGGGAVLGGGDMTADTLNSDNSGQGGAIDFRQNGDILTQGEAAHGIVAQSLGGGGGWVDNSFAGSAGGAGGASDITLHVEGDVLTAGHNAYGIYAQSSGRDGNGDITIDVDGTLLGGSGSGAGVVIDGGRNNTLTVHQALSALSGQAIIGGEGNEQVINKGVVIGGVNLGSGQNSFTNEAGALYLSEGDIILENGALSVGRFINSGEFLMGLSAPRIPIDLAAGETHETIAANARSARSNSSSFISQSRVVNVINLQGSFEQRGDGFMAFDVAYGPYASDRVNVTGSATVDGTGEATLMWLENTTPVTLFAAAQGGVDNGLDFADTLAMQYHILADAQGIHLAFNHDFSQDFMNANAQSMAQHMNSALSQGNAGGMGRFMALMGNMRTGEERIYASMFDEVSAEPYMVPFVLQVDAADRFTRNLFNCRNIGADSSKACHRLTFDHVRNDRSGSADYFAAQGDTTQISDAVELPLNEEWSLLGALGYESLSSMRVDGSRASIRGSGVNAGAGVKWADTSGLDFGFSVTGGWKWLDTNRSVNVFQPERAEANHETQYLQATAKFGHSWSNERLFARVGSSVSSTTLRQSAFSEQGAGGLGIRGEASTETFYSFSPEVSVGAILQNTDTVNTVASLRLSSTHRSVDQLEMPYAFVGAPAGSMSATYGTPLDRHSYNVGFGLDIWSNEQFGAQVTYDHSFGDTLDASAAGIQFKARF